ncbi:MAG: gamma-glutamyltransferase [Deltaproteobacteria bacterium]|nr:gamma-glutamyltransferase [Deltaproteobacteria bacterium]
MLLRLTLGLLFTGLGPVLAWAGGPEPAPLPRTAQGMKGVVASAHPLASAAGIQVLEAGGNAIDAAVATAYALAVVEPYSAGIGGGGFLLTYDPKTQKAQVVDYREVAPKKAHRDLYLVDGKVDPKKSLDGIFAVAVPGMVPGLAEAQARFGKLKLKQVLGPAIALAEQGFLVYPTFREASQYRLEALLAHPEAAKTFLKDGQPYPVGERLRQPVLAKTLKELARVGPKLFTTGRAARAIVKESQRLGGLLTLEDLANFKPRLREPLVGDYRGYTILTMPPPSSGGTHLLQMLELLELERAKVGRRDDLGVADVHFQTEIMRRAYADRAEYMGDPAFVKVPIATLLSPEYLGRRFATIDPEKASSSASTPAGPIESPDTTHLTVIDADGRVVSLTQTVNTGFGSAVVVPEVGVVLNNEMDDFSAAPGVPNAFGLVGGEANSVQPGKIPLSSMTPTIVLEKGQVRLAVGAPGGSTIITTVLQVILHVVDRKLSVAEAVAAPRLHMQWQPDQLRIEPGALSPEVKKGLEQRGHKVVEKGQWGNATAIEVRPDGLRVGVADPRGDGAADAQ